MALNRYPVRVIATATMPKNISKSRSLRTFLRMIASGNDSAVTAIKAGIEKVSFVDGRVPHSVLLEIFTDAGVGTEVVL